MGVPGLWDLLRPAACSHSLSRLSVDAFIANHRGHRGLRVGVDASIWLIHSQTAPGGLNPALRTLFFKLSKLMSLPILPLFVFDGPKRPNMKRGKHVRGAQPRGLKDFIKLINAFGFEYHTAPGEAEAELAHLSKIGIIDVILSDDVDSLLFGGVKILRNWSATLSGNSSSNSKSHADVGTQGDDALAADDNRIETYTLADVGSNASTTVSADGLILVALLAGGDYHPAGVQNCGIKNAFGLARAGFGDKLIQGVRNTPEASLSVFLDEWREEMKQELAHNTAGYLSSKRPAVAASITSQFPDMEVLHRYTDPLTTASQDCEDKYKDGLNDIHFSKEPNIAELARFCEEYFEWGEKSRIIAKFRNSIWDGVYSRALRAAARCIDQGDRGEYNAEVQGQFVKIHQTRNKSKVDKYMEYRLSINPAPYVDVVDEALTGDMKALREARGRNDPALRDLRNALPDEEAAEDSGAGVGAASTADLTQSQSLAQAPSSSQPAHARKSKSVDQHSALRVWIPSQILKAALRDETDAFDQGLTRRDTGTTRVPAMAPSRKPQPIPREDTIADDITSSLPNTPNTPTSRRTKTMDSLNTRGGHGRGRGRGRGAGRGAAASQGAGTGLTRNATMEDFVDFTDTNNPIILPSPPKLKKGQRQRREPKQKAGTTDTGPTARKTSGSKRNVDNRSTDDLGNRNTEPSKRVGEVGAGDREDGVGEAVQPLPAVPHSPQSPSSPAPLAQSATTPTLTTPKRYSLSSPLEASLSPPSPSELFNLAALIQKRRDSHSARKKELEEKRERDKERCESTEKEKEKESEQQLSECTPAQHTPLKSTRKNEPIAIEDSPVNHMRLSHVSHSPISISSDDNTTPQPKKRTSLSPTTKRRRNKSKMLTGVFSATKPALSQSQKKNDVIDLT